MSAVLLQTYAPCAELDGRDGLLACDEDLARRLVDEGRAEIMNPWAEAFRYVPGTPAYAAMRARGVGEVAPTPTEPETIAPAPAKRGPGRPRNQEALL
jgi:hypothetical protein